MTVAGVYLSDVCAISMGQAPKGTSYNTEGIGYPLIAGAGDFGETTPEPSKYTDAPTKLSTPGDVVLCIRATIGDRNWADREYCLGRGVAGLRGDQGKLDQHYLWHWLSYVSPVLRSKGCGATFLQVSKADIASLQIPLSPLAAQERIAGILDAADALRAKRRKSIAQLDTLLQSTFLDMFGDPVTNPMGWGRFRMEDLTSKVTKGTTPTTLGMEFAAEGVPFVRVQNLVDGRIDFSSDALFIDWATHEALRRSQIERRDILISIAGTIGRAAIVHSASALNCNQAVAIVRPREETEPGFLLHWLATEDAQRQMKGKRVTATISNLSLTQIKSLEVPAVPLDLQHRFTAIVESVEQQKASQRAHLAELDTLFGSLQSRAFSGDL